MKKVICLILCTIFLSLGLVSCGNKEIGGDLDDYYEHYSPEVKKDLVLDFYIIVDEGTTDNAIVTVERMINSYLADKFKTTLNMHYITASKYENEIKKAVDAKGEGRADIVLVQGKEMFNSLISNHSLANITSFLDKNEFGKLNTQIAATLLDGSLVKEQRKDYHGDPYDVMNRYMIPNNHVIGNYDYILIDKEAARNLNYSNEKLYFMDTYEKTADLRADLSAEGYDVSKVVKEVSGHYEDKVKYENDGFICNIAKYPTVDESEAYSSGFAVVRAEKDLSYKKIQDDDPNADPETIEKVDTSYLDHYSRCMEIIYAINTDEYLRNLLQYGVKGTNYSVDENGIVTPYTEGPGVYNMNILYTGDVFKAYYSKVLGWTEDVALNGELQNKQSVLPKSE